MPSAMGMDPSMYGMAGMGAMGSIYGMYNPLYMTQMHQQIESNQLQHSIDMHSLTKNMEVANQRRTDNALIEKILTNGDVQNGVKNLYYKVQEGEQDGVRQEFDKLKEIIYNRYNDELVAKGSEVNPETAIVEIIERLYRQIAQSDLESDIRKHGETALQNGFLRGFRGGHSKTYVEETINHCFGRRIDNKGSKEFAQGAGMCFGGIASAVEKGAYGAIAGVAGTGLVLGLGNLFTLGTKNCLKHIGKCWKPAMYIGAIAGIVGDVIWQCARD
jgi:hypothetical protein